MIVHYQDGLSFHVCSDGDKLVVLCINFEDKIHIVRDLSPDDKQELRKRIEAHVAKVHPHLLPALETALT